MTHSVMLGRQTQFDFLFFFLPHLKSINFSFSTKSNRRTVAASDASLQLQLAIHNGHLGQFNCSPHGSHTFLGHTSFHLEEFPAFSLCESTFLLQLQSFSYLFCFQKICCCFWPWRGMKKIQFFIRDFGADIFTVSPLSGSGFCVVYKMADILFFVPLYGGWGLLCCRLISRLGRLQMPHFKNAINYLPIHGQIRQQECYWKHNYH